MLSQRQLDQDRGARDVRGGVDLEALGFDRGVLVQGGAHGTDNAAMLDALQRLGPRVKGIAVLPPGTPLREREALHERG
ncbi:MAG TPA: hypothetical protein PLS34_08405, partial [Gammaproteobacteria bacterium]|nr:hypothetical protein [Gammaproteobacteria bacterium]